MIAGIFAAHGLRYLDPNASAYMHTQYAPNHVPYHTYENHAIKEACRTLAGYKWPLGNMVDPTHLDLTPLRRTLDRLEPDFVKLGVEFYECFATLAHEARTRLDVVKVRRAPEMVADSLSRRFGGDQAEGLRVAKARYKLMDKIPGVNVYSELVARGDWAGSGLTAAFEILGLEFNPRAAQSAVKEGIFTHDRNHSA